MKFVFVALVFFSCFSCSSHGRLQNSLPTIKEMEDEAQIVPLGGNTWASVKEKSGGQVTKKGIENWTSINQSFTVFMRVNKTGIIKLWLEGKVPDGRTELQIAIKGKSKNLLLESSASKYYYAGEWSIKDTGYLAVTISGLKKTGSIFADVSNLKIAGTSINQQAAFVKNNEDNFFYWGRRGPSVHLSYTVPQNVSAEWFYNEVTVPAGNDVIGSYYMANGFAEGYFGIQVNSDTERRILFSVWSPFNTDDPDKIPVDQKIQLLKKGEGVHTGEFGNEGSGGQSYLRYNWKVENTYGFLLHGVPDGPDHTIYTAYFYAPENNEWMLIASFRRPKVSTYLNRLHSFLENFSPEQGLIERKVLFGNQWVKDTSGKWLELNKARFTYDNTAAKKYRMDYAGGLQDNQFYLRNCGFFNDYTNLNSIFERPLTGKQPDIPFSQLK